MDNWLDWIERHSGALWWIAAVSALLFVATLVVVPIVVVQIPHDYFTHDRRPPSAWMPRHPIARLVMLALKNVAGVVLVVAGIAMLVLPGQGILTMFAGMMLLNFPGKYRLEKWLIRQGPTLRTLNWLRRRAGREPLVAGSHSQE